MPHPSVHIALVSLYVIENSGIRTLAAVLRDRGHKVTEIYFKDWINNRIAWPTEQELNNLTRLLRARAVDLVGLSVRASAFIDIAIHITERIRNDVGVPVIWGGIHATSVPEESVQAADAICIGEGELAVPAFVDAFGEKGRILPTDVSNFWVRVGEKVYRNPVAPLCTDLDAIPFKDYHSHEHKFYVDGKRVVRGDPERNARMYLVMASRGCVYSKCSFCINSMLNKVYPGGYRYRRRSVENVIDELVYAKKNLPKLKRIRFDDEIFPLDREWVDTFCDLYEKRVGLPFECHLHPVFYSERNLRKLKAVGLDSVAIGVETSERVARTWYNRNETADNVLKAAGVLHRLGLKACYQVIMDDPVATEQDRQELFDLLLRIPRPYELYLFSLTLYPGTDITTRFLKEGIATLDDVEGRAKKVFSQFRVDLSYPRPRDETFWIALLVLISKDFVPRSWLKRIARSPHARQHIGLLVAAAQAANLLKMSAIAGEMLIKGELSLALLRRWLNPRSLITQ